MESFLSHSLRSPTLSWCPQPLPMQSAFGKLETECPRTNCYAFSVHGNCYFSSTILSTYSLGLLSWEICSRLVNVSKCLPQAARHYGCRRNMNTLCRRSLCPAITYHW